MAAVAAATMSNNKLLMKTNTGGHISSTSTSTSRTSCRSHSHGNVNVNDREAR